MDENTIIIKLNDDGTMTVQGPLDKIRFLGMLEAAKDFVRKASEANEQGGVTIRRGGNVEIIPPTAHIGLRGH